MLYPEHPFIQGLLSDLTNPKALLFFLTFLPQFLAPGQASLPFALALATIDVVIDWVWLSCYVVILGPIYRSCAA
jgi:threonine/homoserine/homoserine lactone efflux protein